MLCEENSWTLSEDLSPPPGNTSFCLTSYFFALSPEAAFKLGHWSTHLHKVNKFQSKLGKVKQAFLISSKQFHTTYSILNHSPLPLINTLSHTGFQVCFQAFSLTYNEQEIQSNALHPPQHDNSDHFGTHLLPHSLTLTSGTHQCIVPTPHRINELWMTLLDTFSNCFWQKWATRVSPTKLVIFIGGKYPGVSPSIDSATFSNSKGQEKRAHFYFCPQK